MVKKILAELILSNKRLILPNLGAFLHRETTQQGTFNITFSPFLKYNDGLLEELIASKLGLSKTDAISLVKKIIDDINSDLMITGMCSIPGIGYLIKDTKGTISLSASEIIEPKPEQWQDSSQNNKPAEIPETLFVKKEDEPETVELNFTETKVPNDKEPFIPDEEDPKPFRGNYTEVSPGVERVNTQVFDSVTIQNDSITDHMTSQSKGKPHKEKKKAMAMLVFLIVSMAVILIFFFAIRELAFAPDEASWEMGNSQVEKIEPIGIPKSNEPANDEIRKEFESTNPYDELEQAKPSKDELSTLKTEDRIEQELTKRQASIQKNETYSLVVGSFSDPTNAKKYAEELKKKGYKSEDITQPNGKRLVVIESFPTREQAENKKDELKSVFPGIWIIKR